MLYFALIADIINSKKSENRALAQLRLQACLDEINRDFAKELASKLTITLGDEFQGLFHSGHCLMEISDRIRQAMQPLELRFAFGLGEILTKINPEQSIGADGPAYWAARKALTELYSDNYYGAGKSRLQVQLDTNKVTQTMAKMLPATLALINDSLNFCDFTAAAWRDTQQELLTKLLEMNCYRPHFDQQELARQLNISPNTLNKRISRSGIKLYLQTRNDIQAYLQQLPDLLTAEGGL